MLQCSETSSVASTVSIVIHKNRVRELLIWTNSAAKRKRQSVRVLLRVRAKKTGGIGGVWCGLGGRRGGWHVCTVRLSARPDLESSVCFVQRTSSLRLGKSATFPADKLGLQARRVVQARHWAVIQI